MRALALFTGLLSQLQRRDTYDDGQYTQVIQTTSWSYSTSYWTSYRSTEIITITSYIPCPVLTSYTTVYKCSSCGACDSCGQTAQTTCSPKLCSTYIYDVVEATTTPYSSGEYAIAYVTSYAGAQALTTSIPASWCTAYEQIDFTGIDCQTLPACGGGTTSGLTCEAKPCTSCIDEDGDGEYETLTEGTQYFYTEFARLTVNGQVTSTPASLCELLTIPTPWYVQPTLACGSDDDDSGAADNGNNNNNQGGQVITYTYTTNGATVVVATSLPSHGGPFHLTGSGSGARVGGELGRNVLFWAWVVGALVAGGGMIVL
ncbi:uncharacterized protein Z520_03272 [Fonsecaea multimorphosa CBS 102226]|uniref:Uncharacterized protein n=1 Tax=Fonsecaea multimorphosa CBS 102226 TaxID=1442371 RepID=A0A0D2KV35_9EURO|nr:uncharacterized protein Z520_03272 [Fonsecaea multimorphosa CBS 102226]KIY00609.1 hypothetical protein Z520_03272 [Fonsecaea multimorphosa CBS 102226]OAL19000.1 hypothetical protein AYO22_10329 [Fonsecaea multimorphosa]